MKEILKKNQAITLVSLVVTIIILIILAGVSINLILGENGIITKAKEAKTKTEQATLNEEIALNELYYQISETSDSSISYDDVEALVEFKRKIASAITDMGIETSESASVDTMASNIRSISGVSSADKVSYDNTNSGLTATNVQNAIDEVNNSLANLLTLDYDNAVTLTPNSAFTPNSNGIIIVTAKSTGTWGNVGLILGNSYVSLGDKWICISQNSDGNNLGINMLVSKGQSYYLHSEYVNIYYSKFVPFK